MKILLIATFSLAACAQTIDFNLDAVAAKAKDKAEITLEGPLLTQALQTAPANVKSAVANVSRQVEHAVAIDDWVWLSFAPEAGVVLTR